MVVRSIKSSVKKNRVLVRLYSRLSMLPDIPIRDYANIRKISLIFDVKPHSMLSYSRLSGLYELSTRMQKEGTEGSFVECGVWNGGSAGIIAKIASHDKDRHVWLFDSWEGLPEPTKDDTLYTGECGEEGMCLGSEGRVRELIFGKLRLSSEKVHLAKGWFDETIPRRRKNIGRIALLHLDCDWYESVKFCLEQLYDDVVKGGFIVIDDYGYWKGCKKAVDEFIKQRSLPVILSSIDYAAVYFRK